MAEASALRKAGSLIGFFLVSMTSQAVLAESMYGGSGEEVWAWEPPLARVAIPGRKLLLRSMPPWRTRPSAALLLELTMSTMYLGLGSRFSAVLPHHLSFLTQTIRSWLWVWYR